MINLLNLSKTELEEFFAGIGEKKFRAKQFRTWLYRGAREFSEMTDLPKDLRTRLESMQAAGDISIGGLEVLDIRSSADKSTEKFLFGLEDGKTIETVLMRYKYGNSVCVSSQAGCRMGCSFCASTIGGLERDLEPAEIAAQVIAVTRHIKDEKGLPLASNDERIGHIVIMGTGEPFDNYDNVTEFIRIVNMKDGLDIGLRNITLSTCGIVPKIEEFTKEMPQVNLAISLHAPDNETRSRIMPVNRKYPIEELLPACMKHAKITGRRVTFEYALTAGVNDSTGQAQILGNLLKKYFNAKSDTAGLCHVNLIPLNAVKETGLSATNKVQAESFKDKLESMGIPATIRREMGADINAACGQLRLGNKYSV